MPTARARYDSDDRGASAPHVGEDRLATHTYCPRCGVKIEQDGKGTECWDQFLQNLTF